jgi:hypothetical protein
MIRESYHPGVVTKVEVRESGASTWHTVWQDVDPSDPNNMDFYVSFDQTAYLVDAVRITIDSNHFYQDFEEIDAVRLDGLNTLPAMRRTSHHQNDLALLAALANSWY